MRIALDARFLDSDKMPEERDFTKEVFSRLAAQHPEHEFLYFVENALHKSICFCKNVTIAKITPKPTNFLLHKWWYDVKLPLALKKYKADIFIATYGLGSLTASIPQILILRDISFLHKGFYTNSNAFCKKYTSKFIKKSKVVISLSGAVRSEALTVYKLKNKSIETIGTGVDDSYKPIVWEEREAVKKQFAEGCEYFVFTGLHLTGADFLNMLKAFSIFKKWQKTNMKLVIAGKFDLAMEKELAKLNSYKYKKEVFVKSDLSNNEMSSIIAACYALILPSLYNGFASHALAAMQCQIPVIAMANSSTIEIAGNAALYADASDPYQIADQMKLIFKDELLRNRLIEASKLRAPLFSWDKTAAHLWRVIEETLSR